MRKGRKKFIKENRVRINHQIRASEVRVIGAEGENLGVMTPNKALEKAFEVGLDLVEITPKAIPPVVRITDYGRFSYDSKKKARESKAKQKTTETKTIQIKIGTSEGDLILKAKRISEWLAESHRVKLDLFLWGRYKYMEEAFKKERLERVLQFISVDYKIADAAKKSPKGLSVILEKEKKSKVKQDEDK